MKSVRLVICAAVIAAAGLLVGCGASENKVDPEAGSGAEAPSGELRIVTTTTQASDLTRILVGDIREIVVTPLMGAGVDPHLYQPTESDIAAMNRADMVIYSGLHLEGQFDTVFEALREQGVVIHALSTAVKQGGFVIGAYGGEGSVSGGDDPHFWFDPRNWEVTVTDLADTLSRINPANAATYQNNASEYVEQLRLLQEWALSGMMSVPERQRYLVTSHDAFQYFGAALGWKMKAIQGISTEDEAGVGDIQQIVDFVLTQEIPVLFVESSIPPDTIQAVRRAIEAAGGSVRLGARELFGDAMGEPGTFGGTYVGMIAHNVYTILQSYRLAGLAVEIPAWPEGLVPKPPEIFGGDP